MKKVILSLLLPLLLTGCSFPLNGGKKAALSITTTPRTAVFLDGENIGSTPYYDEKLKPGDYSLRLVPEGNEGQPWETRVTLHSGIYTVISRELSETNEKSSGYVLSLDPQSEKEQASLLVVTTPDGAVISVDGEPRGFSPVAVSNLTEGDHTLVISSPGYYDKSIKAQLVNGYKLTANVQLAKSDKKAADTKKTTEVKTDDTKETEESPEAEEVIDADVEEKEDASDKESVTKGSDDLDPPYVIIKETNTGWLNVREEPSTATDNIITKIDPGDQYAFIDSNSTGWYQIKLPNGKKGWISGKYATLVEE